VRGYIEDISREKVEKIVRKLKVSSQSDFHTWSTQMFWLMVTVCMCVLSNASATSPR